MKLFLLLPVVAAMTADAATLINVDYTAHLNPAFSVETGPAVVGNSPADYWNVYSRDVSSEFDWRCCGTIDDLKYSDGTSSGAQLTVSNAPGAWYTLNPDAMFNSYLYSFDGNPIISQFTKLPAGTYDLYVYAHGLPAAENAALNLTDGAVSYGPLSTSSNPAADTPGWTEGFEYVVFHNVSVSAGDTLTLTSSRLDAAMPVINGLQLMTVPEAGGTTVIAAAAMVGLCAFRQKLQGAVC